MRMSMWQLVLREQSSVLNLEIHRMHKMMEPLHLKIVKENGMDHAEKMRRFRLIAVQEEVMKCEMGK